MATMGPNTLNGTDETDDEHKAAKAKAADLANQSAPQSNADTATQNPKTP